MSKARWVMFHKGRTWAIHRVDSAETLAEMLTERTWTLCSGFVIEGHEEYLFLNDSTHEDGAGEYGVIRGGLTADRRHQIESITLCWRGAIRGLLRGWGTGMVGTVCRVRPGTGRS